MFDPVVYEQAQIAIERARMIAPAQTFTAYVLALMPAVLVVLCLALLAALLELIAQEYRKKWGYLSASGEIWTAACMTSGYATRWHRSCAIG